VIKRIFDIATTLELRSNLSRSNELDVYLEQASRVDNLIADASTGLTGALQNFFSAVQGVADDPTSIAARQVLVSQGDLLATRFNTLVEQLDAQTRALNTGVQTAAEEITALGKSIAELNVKIAAASGGGQGQPNDLLDQRDNLINRLAELVDITTLQQDDGSINVFVGKGQALVVGATSNSLIARPRTNDPKNMDVVLQSGGGNVVVTEAVTGGKLGGYLKFRKEILEPAFNLIGRVAMGVADQLNQQHRLGMDLNNNLGQLFYTDINDPALMSRRVINDSGNTGTADISIQIDDTSLLNDANYELRFQGGNYVLTNTSTGATVSSFPPPGALPATVSVPSEGFSIVINSGLAAAGDRFAVFPTRSFGADISMQISDPNYIAAALPVNAQLASTNTGAATISGISVTDTSTPQFTNVANDLDPPLIFEFISPTSFNVIDANTLAVVSGPVAGFVPNQDNNMLALAGLSYGYEVTISGAPATGDRVNVTYNSNGVGDNRNMLLIGDLQQANSLDNGSSNFQQSFGRLVSDVGTRTQEARINSEASQTLLAQVKDRRESISGVNLDEEAAKLIKFEQAYQASAQVIQVARTIFQTIIDSTR
jgi:flagellar hook-associated protein 1 FlgK